MYNFHLDVLLVSDDYYIACSYFIKQCAFLHGGDNNLTRKYFGFGSVADHTTLECLYKYIKADGCPGYVVESNALHVVLRYIFQAHYPGKPAGIIDNRNRTHTLLPHQYGQGLNRIADVDRYGLTKFKVTHRCRKAFDLIRHRDPEPLKNKASLFVDLSCTRRRKEEPFIRKVLKMRVGYCRTDGV